MINKINKWERNLTNLKLNEQMIDKINKCLTKINKCLTKLTNYPFSTERLDRFHCGLFNKMIYAFMHLK